MLNQVMDILGKLGNGTKKSQRKSFNAFFVLSQPSDWLQPSLWIKKLDYLNSI